MCGERTSARQDRGFAPRGGVLSGLSAYGKMRPRPCSERDPPDAEIMLVGEQPGDREDREGRPFVGPAGQLLDRAMAEAGVDRNRVYVTNAVKHFKFEPRGKRRLHKRPNASEIKICRHWLFDEIEAIGPRDYCRPWSHGRAKSGRTGDPGSDQSRQDPRMRPTGCRFSSPFTRLRCFACGMRKRNAQATQVS